MESGKIFPRIESLYQTCEACPSQWEGITSNGLNLYVRYRWGGLRAITYEEDMMCPKLDFFEEVGGQYDGYMTTGEMIERTKHILDWSKIIQEVDQEVKSVLDDHE